MIKIRLKRYGKKREVSYRIVAMNSRDRRDGRPLEELGFYNPRTDETRLNVPAIVKRLQQGAQPTETVRHILIKAQVLEQVKGRPVAAAPAGVQTAPAAIAEASPTATIAAPVVEEITAAPEETAPVVEEVTPAPEETVPAVTESATVETEEE